MKKGISKSLDKLFLTQSAVSHQLKDIEERIGVKIFYRTKNQWILTDEGKILYDTATRVLAEIEQANAKINDLRMGHTGDIRISTECYTSYHWLPAFMVKMKLLYPKLNVKIVMEATHKPLQKLLNNELDVGITSDPLNDKSIRYIELFKDEVMAVVPAGHALSSKKTPYRGGFCLRSFDHPLLSVRNRYRLPAFFKGSRKYSQSEIMAIPLTEVALEMVKAGMGIMTMPVWALKPFATSDAFVLVSASAPKGLSAPIMPPSGTKTATKNTSWSL
jgi:LysR family transcriptional regulator for metE and metH